MRKIFVVLIVALSFIAANAFARGGGFSSGRSSFGGGRSSFGGGSFSSGRSSFSSGSSSKSSSSSSSRGSSFGSSSHGFFGSGGSKSTFGTSSKGRFGMGDTKASQYSSPKVFTAKDRLYESKTTVYMPNRVSIPIYYYYYPSPWYGSGYGFYQWYFWSHMFGNHSHCYHVGGSLNQPRKCEKDSQCYNGEFCELKVHECKLKQ